MENVQIAQTWSEFISANLPDVIKAAPLFELGEATGIPTSVIHNKRDTLSEEQFVDFILEYGHPVEEIANVLSAHEPWKFGYSEEQFWEE